MDGKAKILVYGLSRERQRRIDDGLVWLGVPPALQARPGQEGLPLRSVLAGVRALLDFFRQTVARRPLFAVATPTSLDLTLGKLLAHLAEERAALGEGK